jgi:hypothetical protein
MKYLLFKTNNCLLLVLLASFAIALQACTKKDSGMAPHITGVRNYAASPADSSLTSTGPGKWIVIEGMNLKGALAIYFDGVAASFNEALFSENSAAVLIPSVIAFPSVPAASLNTIRYVTSRGETTFSFPILPPAPSITSISNENANAGDSVTIYGLNFFFVQTVNYAGIAVTAFSPSADGTAIGFRVPAALAQSGVVTVVTKAGTATTVFKVNDVKTGVLCNFDDINNYSWGAASVSSDATAFPGNRQAYGRLTAAVAANDFAWYNGGRGFNMNAAQWIPVANVGDSAAKYALKFEMYVKQGWNAGYLFFAKDYDWTYIARYAPWLNTDGSTVSFTTKNGWQTITIPMTTFRLKANGLDGTGNSIVFLKDLLGSSGNAGLNVWLINPTSSVPGTIDGVFDNFRIVKIQ